MVLPRFIVFKESNPTYYLACLHYGELFDGYLVYSEPLPESPFARFEVEKASIDGLVHIRSCRNNKYWVRSEYSLNPEVANSFIAAADKPEEDQSKESCTLFKPISPAANTVRIMHVQSGSYLSVTGGWLTLSNQGHNFQFIDWESLVILPRYVAFKADNSKYLVPRWHGYPFLRFEADNLRDPTVPCEVSATSDGYVNIKQISANKYLRFDPYWIRVDSDDPEDNATRFRPFKLDNQTIALSTYNKEYFCSRSTLEQPHTDYLVAGIASITKESYFTVEETIISREIYDVRYHVDDSRVYNETAVVVAHNSVSNYTQEPSSLDVKLIYQDVWSTTWKAFFSLTLGMKVTTEFGVPLIFNGKVEMSGEVKSGFEWGTTSTTTNTLEVVHRVVVPPTSKVRVNMIVTKGLCDVPFTYMQRDTLYNGEVVRTEVDGGVFTGSNYYNIEFEDKPEPLDALLPSPEHELRK